MNSFKKITLGMVAAITMGTLIATPASAAVSTTLTVGGSAPATAGTTSATAIALPVPADNSVDSADALKIALTGLDTGTVVSAAVTNGKIVTALATVAAPVSASAGTTTSSINTGTGTTADFYVFTTSTAAGFVSVTVGGNTTTYYFNGTAGALNTIAVDAPSSGAAGTTATVKVIGYDVFGNAKGNAAISLQYITPTTTTTYSLTTDTATATLGTKTQDVTLPASGSVTIVASATVASAVTGLTAPLGVIVKTAVVRDLATELAIVQAQLAAANTALSSAKADLATAQAALATEKAAHATTKAAADFAAATYKAEYNALAKKWNAKNPKAKVALKK